MSLRVSPFTVEPPIKTKYWLFIASIVWFILPAGDTWMANYTGLNVTVFWIVSTIISYKIELDCCVFRSIPPNPNTRFPI